MTFKTALSLSFNNLRTKKARTFLVAAAGSIGIIGIALVSSLSHGATAYINEMEKQAMGSYPLQITSLGYDFTSMMSSAEEEAETEDDTDDNTVKVAKTLTSAMSEAKDNDLASLKTYLESGESGIEDCASDIEYLYDAEPMIYQVKGSSVWKVSPSETGGTATLFSTSTNSSDFYQLPENRSLYENDYELKKGHWPENENEAVLVLSSSGRITDAMLYELGILDYGDYESIMEAIENNESYEVGDYDSSYTYEQLLGCSWKVLSASDLYSYDESVGVYTDKSSDTAYLREKTDEGIPLTVVGIVELSDDIETGTLSTGIAYSKALTEAVMKRAEESDAVKAQTADPQTNVLTGKAFDAEETGLDLTDLISVNEDALSSLSAPDLELSNVDLSSLMDMNTLQAALPDVSPDTLNTLLQSVTVSVDTDAVNQLIHTLWTDYTDENSDVIHAYTDSLSQYLQSERARKIISTYFSEALKDGSLSQTALENTASELIRAFADYSSRQSDPSAAETNMNAWLSSEEGKNAVQKVSDTLIQGIQNTVLSEDRLPSLFNDLQTDWQAYAEENGILSEENLRTSLSDYLQKEEVQKQIRDTLSESIDTEALSSSLTSLLQDTANTYASAYTAQLNSVINTVIQQYSAQIQNAMNSYTLDEDSLSSLFTVKMNEEDLQSLLTSMFASTQSSYESNLAAFGYADLSSPSEIDIYPKDFNARSSVRDILDAYNDDMKDRGETDKVIVYSDLVASMLKSVTDIINTISYILIAFVAISLVVSSIMIGVITYISVLERRKEIGILRALGASKHNVAEVFNAETFITGALSGGMGVAAAVLLCFPLNIVIHHIAETDQINASLPVSYGIVLILLSIFLTVLAGLIPSRKAAKSDPVAALRSE